MCRRYQRGGVGRHALPCLASRLCLWAMCLCRRLLGRCAILRLLSVNKVYGNVLPRVTRYALLGMLVTPPEPIGSICTCRCNLHVPVHPVYGVCSAGCFVNCVVVLVFLAWRRCWSLTSRGLGCPTDSLHFIFPLRGERKKQCRLRSSSAGPIVVALAHCCCISTCQRQAARA